MNEIVLTWKPSLSISAEYVRRVYKWGTFTGFLHLDTKEWKAEQRILLQAVPLIERSIPVKRAAPPAIVDDAWEETIIEIRMSSENYKEQLALATSLGCPIDNSTIHVCEKEFLSSPPVPPVEPVLPSLPVSPAAQQGPQAPQAQRGPQAPQAQRVLPAQRVLLQAPQAQRAPLQAQRAPLQAQRAPPQAQRGPTSLPFHSKKNYTGSERHVGVRSVPKGRDPIKSTLSNVIEFLSDS